jgi:2-methylcitrate dehydratase PrpD
MSPKRTDFPTAHVKIALSDGRVLEATTTVPRGDAENPVPAEEIAAKFLALAAPVLGEPRARRVADAVREIETVKDVGELTALLAPE